MNLLLYFGIACLAFLSSPDSAVTEADAAAIVRRSVETNIRNYAALPQFNYYKVEQGKDGISRT